MRLRKFVFLILLLSVYSVSFSQNIQNLNSGFTFRFLSDKNSGKKELFTDISETQNGLHDSFKNKLILPFVKSGGTREKLNLNEEDTKTDFLISATGGYLKEIEENYNTASIYQSYKMKYFFSEKFNLGMALRIEYAKREELGFEDVTRWYDNTVLTANYNFNPYNSVNIFGGVSISDTTLTTYGFSYSVLFEKNEFSLENNLVLSNDYFYYWNDVTQNFASDNLNLTYDRFNLSAEFFYGVVELNYIENYTALAENPNTSFNVQLQYRIFADPVVRVGALYNTRNFEYQSPLYYSPSHRKIAGGFANFYDSFGKIYLYLSGGMRSDNEGVFIWDFDSEIGYDYNNLSFSLGIGRYNDPYYTNYNTFLNITKMF